MNVAGGAKAAEIMARNPTPNPAQDSGLAQAHARLITDGTMQFDLPGFVPPQVPAWLKPLIEFLEWLSPAFPYIFWGAVAMGVALIAWVVIREFSGVAFVLPWRRKPVLAEAEDDWRPDEQVARALLAEAEALARDGRYAEAARLLLRRSVEDIGERRPAFITPSLTARDIAAAPALPVGARAAFGAIAGVVEISTFGSAALTAAAWDQCRAAYGNFALAGAWHG
jgi:hypothetical protein